MPVAGIIAFIGVLGFTGASFFFALAETALFSLGRLRARQLAANHPQSGEQVVRLLDKSPEVLATLVLGNVFANAAIVSIGVELVLRWDWNFLWTLPPLLLLLLLGGEVIPKTMAARRPEEWALRIAHPLLLFYSVATPFRVVAQKLTGVLFHLIVPSSWRVRTGFSEEEYYELLELGVQQGTLAKSEKEIINKIIRLDRRTARDVMKPRTRMAAISDDLSIEEMVEAARKHKHRRLPIYDETPDTIVGILNVRKFLLDPAIDLSEVIEFPSFVPETMNLLQLLKSLQHQRRGLAVVMDEYGGVAGIVTLEDLIEEVVGEMKDTDQADLAWIRKLSPGKWRLHGQARLDDFILEYPEIGEMPGVDTIGGLLLHLFEIVPAPGETASHRGLKLTVVASDERRILEVEAEATKKR